MIKKISMFTFLSFMYFNASMSMNNFLNLNDTQVNDTQERVFSPLSRRQWQSQVEEPSPLDPPTPIDPPIPIPIRRSPIGLSLQMPLKPVGLIQSLGGQTNSTYGFYDSSIKNGISKIVMKSWDNYHLAVNELLAFELFSTCNLIKSAPYDVFFYKDLPPALQKHCSSSHPLSLVRITKFIDEKWPRESDLKELEPFSNFLSFSDLHERNFKLVSGRLCLIDSGGSLLYWPMGSKKEDFFNVELRKGRHINHFIRFLHQNSEEYTSLLMEKKAILHTAECFLNELKYPLKREIISYLEKRFVRLEYLAEQSENKYKIFFDSYERGNIFTNVEVIFSSPKECILLELINSEFNNPFKADCKRGEYIWQTALRIVEKATQTIIPDGFLKIMSCLSYDEVKTVNGMLRKKRYYFLPLSNEMIDLICKNSQINCNFLPLNNGEKSFTPILMNFGVSSAQLSTSKPGINYKNILSSASNLTILDSKIGQAIIKILSQERLKLVQGDDKLLSKFNENQFVAHVLTVLKNVLRERSIEDFESSLDKLNFSEPWEFLSTQFFEIGLKNDDVEYLINNLKNMYNKMHDKQVYLSVLNNSIYEVLNSRFYEFLEALIYSKNFFKDVDEPEIIKEISKNIEHQPFEKINRHPLVIDTIQSAYENLDISFLHTYLKNDTSALSNIEIDYLSPRVKHISCNRLKASSSGLRKNEFLEQTWVKYLDPNKINYIGLQNVEALIKGLSDIKLEGIDKIRMVERLISVPDITPKFISDVIDILNLLKMADLLREEIIDSALLIASKIPPDFHNLFRDNALKDTSLFKVLSNLIANEENVNVAFDIIRYIPDTDFIKFLLKNIADIYSKNNFDYNLIVKKYLKKFYKKNRKNIKPFLEFLGNSDWVDALSIIEWVDVIQKHLREELTVPRVIELLKEAPKEKFEDLKNLFIKIDGIFPYSKENFFIFKSFFDLFCDKDFALKNVIYFIKNYQICRYLDELITSLEINTPKNVSDVIAMIKENFHLIEDKDFNNFYKFSIILLDGIFESEDTADKFIKVIKFASSKINMNTIIHPSKLNVYLSLFEGDDLVDIDLEYVEKVVNCIDKKYKDFSSSETYEDFEEEIKGIHIMLLGNPPKN